MHIVLFLAGVVVATAAVVLAAWAAGLPGLAIFGLGAATLLVAQALYLVWIVGMAGAEARRRRQEAGKAAAGTSSANRQGKTAH